MIEFTSKGDFLNIQKFLNKNKTKDYTLILNNYGRLGVLELRNATPKRTGKTAESWYYEIQNEKDGMSLNFYNSNINKGVHIALLIQYGHLTGTGGWVEGHDYINPIVNRIMNDLSRTLELEGIL